MDNKSEVAENAVAAASQAKGKGKKKNWRSGTKVEKAVPLSGPRSVDPSTLPGPTMSLEALNARLEQSFPSSQDTITPYVSMPIDTYGYMKLCSSVYDSLALNRNFREAISKPEFTMAMGYALSKRVYDVNKSVLALPSLRDLDYIPKMEVPEPIALYLDCLGHVKLSTGEIVVPDLIIPDLDEKNQSSRCTSINSNGLTDYDNLRQGMFPYIPLARAIMLGKVGHYCWTRDFSLNMRDWSPEDAKAYYAKLKAENKSQGQLTPPYSYGGVLTNFEQGYDEQDELWMLWKKAYKATAASLIDMAGANLISDSVKKGFTAITGGLSSVYYNDMLMARYQQSLPTLRKQMVARFPTDGHNGSEALLIVATALARYDSSPGFAFNAPYVVPQAMANLGRVFLFRRSLAPDDQAAIKGDKDKVLLGPGICRVPGSVRISPCDSHNVMLHLLVSFYVSK